MLLPALNLVNLSLSRILERSSEIGVRKAFGASSWTLFGQFLVENQWTSKDRLMAEGGSAGGLLMGAVVNMQPDLFRAIHSAVPFVDVMNTMMDASLPLTVGQYLEWGDPNEKPAFD